MSPIRPEEKSRYPDDWPAISLAVRADADDRCECEGECGWPKHVGATIDDQGRDVVGRCEARNREPHPYTGSRVVLTVAHLDHTPEHNARENLKAMCQGCHLHYDRDHHAATRKARAAALSQALTSGIVHHPTPLDLPRPASPPPTTGMLDALTYAIDAARRTRREEA